MSTVSRGPVGEQRLVIYDVSWRDYLRQLRVFADRRIRVTYDRRAMEIMTISPRHERYKHLLGILAVILLEELGWEYAAFGSMTFKRKRKRRGFEPDECYWIQNEPLVRGKEDIDVRTDPPPDLALEVEVSRSLLNRLGIYAAWGVFEVWRYDGQKLRVGLLGPDGQYQDSPTSRAFPFLPLAEVEHLLNQRTTLGNTALLRALRTRVRQQITAGWAPPASGPTP
jgi:Uma2 family endonuclease